MTWQNLSHKDDKTTLMLKYRGFKIQHHETKLCLLWQRFCNICSVCCFCLCVLKKESTSVTVVIHDFRLAFYCGCGKWQKYIHYIRTKCSRPTACLLRLDFEQFHNAQLHVQIMKTRIGEKNGLWQRRTHFYLWIAEGTAALLNEDKCCLVSAHKPL